MKYLPLYLFLIYACILTGCTKKPRPPAEAHLSFGTQKISFHAPEVGPEREIVVIIGSCLARPTDDVFKAPKDGLVPSGPFANPVAVAAFLEKQNHVRLIVQSLVVVDKRIERDFTLGGPPTCVTLKTNSRFIHVRAEFPDDGDHTEAIIDLNCGQYIMIERFGEESTFKQYKEEPTLM